MVKAHGYPQPEPAEMERLSSSGYVSLGGLLTSDQCSELRQYFEARKVFDPYIPGSPRIYPASNSRSHGHVMHHDAHDVIAAPHLMSLANSSAILSLVAGYFGCKPTISYMAAWWSYPTRQGPQQAENFHRDVDDWRFLKLFVYLTDVSELNGPHVYVLHSANDSRLRAIRRYSDEEVANAFGLKNILRVYGDAGVAFLEDTNGMHRGEPVLTGRRLVFQVVYALTPLPYAPRHPVGSHSSFPSLDRWVNRVYLA